MNRAVMAWLIMLVVALSAYGAYKFTRKVDSQSQGPPQQPPVNPYGYPVGQFQLVDSQGKPFSPRQLEGKVWIASFFFTRCQSACVKLNNRIAQLLAGDLKELPVVFVSISVDPENDRPEVLQEYAKHFFHQYDVDPNRWVFLTSPDGSVEPIKQVCQQNFKVAFGKVTHSDRFMLVDAQGRVQGSYSSTFDVDVARLKRKLKELLPAGKRDSAAEPAVSEEGKPQQDQKSKQQPATEPEETATTGKEK